MKNQHIHENRLSADDICASTVQLKKIFHIPRAKIKVVRPEFQMGRVPEILDSLTILDFAHVCSTCAKKMTKN